MEAAHDSEMKRGMQQHSKSE